MSQYPSISINTFHDVEIIVRYFECNRGSYDNVVESWIRDNIGEDKEILSYYSQQMGNTINNYWNIASKRSKVFNRRHKEKLDKRIKRFEDLVIKLKAFKQEFEAMTISMTIERQWVYKVVSLPQPFASLLVLGLLDEFRVTNIELCKEGDFVYVYSTEMTEDAKEKLWYDNYIYGKYYNALEMGNLPEELPINSYIGQFRIKDYRPYKKVGIDKVLVFDNPIICGYSEMPQFIATYSRHQAPLKKIRFRNHTIEVPLSEENYWEILGNMKDEFVLYWEEDYSQFCSLWGSIKDEQGLYDIVFYNGTNRKRYCQLDNQAVVRNVRKDKQTNITFYVLEFYFEHIEEKKDSENSSFDILQKKDWILDWNCVKFKDGYIVVSAPLDDSVKFKTKAFPLKGSIEAFNYLKDYLNDRLASVHCTVEKMNLTIYDQIRLNEAIEKFATASRQTGIKTAATSPTRRIAPIQMSFKQALSKAQEMTPEEFKKYKSKYIDHLVTLQSRKYKVIPCVERLAHSTGDATEYAFMFSIECSSGKILIVHENVNPDRSTLLFVVKHDAYDKSIREIYNFLQSAEINKRSSLRSKDLDLDDAQITSYKSINHDDLYSWKQTISTYKRYR